MFSTIAYYINGTQKSLKEALIDRHNSFLQHYTHKGGFNWIHVQAIISIHAHLSFVHKWIKCQFMVLNFSFWIWKLHQPKTWWSFSTKTKIYSQSLLSLLWELIINQNHCWAKHLNANQYLQDLFTSIVKRRPLESEVRMYTCLANFLALLQYSCSQVPTWQGKLD